MLQDNNEKANTYFVLLIQRFGSGHGQNRPESSSPNLGPTSGSSVSSSVTSEATRNFVNQFNVSHALHPPSQVELRESGSGQPGLGVWAVDTIPAGSKFGPFLGKWSLEPINPNQAWEVSEICPFFASRLMGSRIIESATYCYQIFLVLLSSQTVHKNVG